MEAITTTQQVDILDKTFRTSDGRILTVWSDHFSNTGKLVIMLGNTGRFPFEGKDYEAKCARKLRWFIKELDAVEVDE